MGEYRSSPSSSPMKSPSQDESVRHDDVRSLSSVVRSQPLAEGARSLSQEKSEVGKWREGWNVSGIRDEIE